ncbi:MULTISPECIES: SDR family NAD(P)-dependent oxidoreductase [unclassified Rhizobium]|uniref:SDR family NAD(P)-dependent oxidoreductase n=1 Tax=unclassified Rhizobium TaxID=2613769 RepID=UPI001ADD2B48|nr:MULTISPECIES: glucose 1-dehydrogenase [unclassified Rhizobium]MBO9127595.1 glucose 1-dehydrogenase [Rhizobium sp. 16-488-2b]MBO9178038.1 glucose 1-dehydrogenase [Rhizobium sp. 16-488-2a]
MSGHSFNLKGRVAVVTGASRGLGQAIALALADAGADLCITARELASLQDTKAKVEGRGVHCIAVAQDVSDLTSIDAALEHACALTGGIDILVNNAGIEQVSPSLDVDEALWDRIVGTNLKGAFFWSQAAAKRMSKQETGGSIINLCSLTSFVGVPTAVPYGSSKSGLLGMTRALAAEWAEAGIRVNAIAPGYFRTAMTDGFYEDEDWQARMLARIPQRRFGEAADLGGAVVFLASDAAGYITGHCLPVDGGFLASI